MNNIGQDNRLRNLERARSAQEREVAYRNEKRWKIFSWSSSLLIGSIAGAVAIKNINLGIPERILLCFAVIALASYTVLWLNFNRHLLDNAEKKVKKIDEELGTYNGIDFEEVSIPLWLKVVSYGSTVALLTAIAILMILLPCIIKYVGFALQKFYKYF
jgi:hypothetical protein